MKTLTLLLFIPLLLIACQKGATIAPKTTSITSQPVKTPVIATVNTDTLADKATFKLQLVEDSTTFDETMFMFKKAADPNFDPMEDARYFGGYGQVSLASIAADGTDLAINDLPYIPGSIIGLDVHTRSDGAFSLKIGYQNKIPSDKHIWLKDNYLKDSVDLHTTDYNFTVSKADTNTFGNKRFKLVVKQ